MSRIDPAKRYLLITGVGFRGDEEIAHQGNIFESSGLKPNIGASVALAAARLGYSLVLVSRTRSKLELVRQSIHKLLPEAKTTACVVDLLDSDATKQLTEAVPSDAELDLVHCAGLSAGSYILPGDNPYLPLGKTPPELATLEFEAVVRSLLNIVLAFVERLKLQKAATIVVVSSMSGIRAVPWGFAHSSAKGGLRQAVRSLVLELNPLGIRVCEVQPGMVDTGLYDSAEVRAAIQHMGHTFGYNYDADKVPTMKPSAVADAVTLCLTSDAHVLAISLVARGQFPNLGA